MTVTLLGTAAALLTCKVNFETSYLLSEAASADLFGENLDIIAPSVSTMQLPE